MTIDGLTCYLDYIFTKKKKSTTLMFTQQQRKKKSFSIKYNFVPFKNLTNPL